ncbi:MAG: hypothetical protein RSE37_20800, partial [Citrobacter sp.]
AVEGTGLENRRPERVLEFESLRFRQIRNPSRYATWVFSFYSVLVAAFNVSGKQIQRVSHVSRGLTP